MARPQRPLGASGADRRLRSGDLTQLSGIEMIVYYTPAILTDSGFSDSTALQVSVALGVTYLIAQLIGLAIIDRVGRRRLTLLTLPGAAGALIVLGPSSSEATRTRPACRGSWPPSSSSWPSPPVAFS
jgi:MFS family permease